MPIDTYKTYQRGLTAPAADAFPINPVDDADLSKVARAIYVGGAGDVTLTTIEGSQVTFKALIAGTVLPVSAAQVHLTGTTATNLVALV